MSTPLPSLRKNIIVLGAGVVGLTTALRIQEQGRYKVTIVADVLPSDPQSIKYTSQWAGAHHVLNVTDDTVQSRLENETFDTMWEMSQPGSDAEECFLRVPQTEYFSDVRGAKEPLESMPEFRRLADNELIPGAVSGITFHTLTIDTPIYLNYLLTQFLGLGGRIFRGSIQHINQIIEGGSSIFKPGDNTNPPDAIVVCVGIGARFLGGVEDKNVYPIRGQTVIVRAPWVRFGRTLYENNAAMTYIIPRRSGDVRDLHLSLSSNPNPPLVQIVIGGTRVADDWYPKPRPEISRDILERGFALCPELAPPEIRSTHKPTVDDVLPHVVGEGCGLRPARKGGIRMETEWVEGVDGRGKVPVIHNYGHGGFGYQTSWGSADVVIELLCEAFDTLEAQES
ncbi:D-aspartate oxidase [Cyathus striatus]|nr:D-aspartate oxidase [Cyathus striatus]